MSIWDAGTITRFSEQAEDLFATDYPCIVNRVALAIVSGTASYALPELLLSIRRVTWKGLKIHPMPTRLMNDYFQGALNTQVGRPEYYLFNGISANTIKLFPTPNESIAATSTDLYGAAIKNKAIIEYYQLPDHSVKVIPPFFRRRLLKSYVLHRCFMIEGQGQNLKNSRYHGQKFESLKAAYGALLSEIFNKPRRLITTGGVTFQDRTPSSPMYSLSRFGTSVDEGE